MGWRGLIEFGNGPLVLATAVGWVILTARCAKPVRRDVLRLGWRQLTVVAANALLGGVTVPTGLAPYSLGQFR